MEKIALEEIQYYVSNPNYLEQLQEQALDLRKELCNLDDQHSSLIADIYETAQVSVHYDGNGGSSSGKKKKDLGDLLLITKKMIEKHREELVLKYRVVLEQMDQCHRLRLAFDTLDVTSKEVLTRLYVEKEKWEWIEHDLELSHRKMVAIRKEAILTMQSRYNSDLTNRQLAEWCESSRFQVRHQKYGGKKKNIEGQLSLASMFDGKEGSAT